MYRTAESNQSKFCFSLSVPVVSLSYTVIRCDKRIGMQQQWGWEFLLRSGGAIGAFVYEPEYTTEELKELERNYTLNVWAIRIGKEF